VATLTEQERGALEKLINRSMGYERFSLKANRTGRNLLKKAII